MFGIIWAVNKLGLKIWTSKEFFHFFLSFQLQKSGMVPGVGLMHAPFALFPTSFPESKWKQASDLAPIFNELVDRVSLDGEFLQESLSRSVLLIHFTSLLLYYSYSLSSGSPFSFVWFGTTQYLPFFYVFSIFSF